MSSKRTADDAGVSAVPRTKTPITYKANTMRSGTIETLHDKSNFIVSIKHDHYNYSVEFLRLSLPDEEWKNNICANCTVLRAHLSQLTTEEGWFVDKILESAFYVVPTIGENNSREALRAKGRQLVTMVTWDTYIPTLKSLIVRKLFRTPGASLAMILSQQPAGLNALMMAVTESPNKQKLIADIERHGTRQALCKWFDESLCRISGPQRTSENIIARLMESGISCIPVEYIPRAPADDHDTESEHDIEDEDW